MAYKDILVHAGGSAFDARANVAANVAEAFDAHLTGLYVVTPPEIPPYVEAQLTADVMEAQDRFQREDCAQARAVFESATAGAAFPTEWREAEGRRIETVQLHGRHADLVVVGQAGADSDDPLQADLAGRLVLSLGRPVLVVPYAGSYPTMGSRILVGWDASRTAARALGDAMPFLKRAAEVQVLSLNPPAEHADMAGVDIAQHLSRHGVKVEAQHLNAPDVDVGAMLLSRAADFGADMIVMGAYGHARWREVVLGGATEHILHAMTAPVLMAH